MRPVPAQRGLSREISKATAKVYTRRSRSTQEPELTRDAPLRHQPEPLEYSPQPGAFRVFSEINQTEAWHQK